MRCALPQNAVFRTLCVGICLHGIVVSQGGPVESGGTLVLRYDRPAEMWEAALPIGNGRLGAMVFGGVYRERLQLNESTLWSGGPKDWNNPRAKDYLPQIRRLIKAGRYPEADSVYKRMQGPRVQAYMPMGDLYREFSHFGPYDDYQRTLNLDNAITSVSYRIENVTYTREVFASYPDRVIVMRLTADQPGCISFIARLSSLLRHRTRDSAVDQLNMRGRAPAHVGHHGIRTTDAVSYSESPEGAGMHFETLLQAKADGGQVAAYDGGLRVDRANAVTLLVSAATSYNGFKDPQGADPAHRVGRDARAAGRRSYRQLRERHTADHQSLFGRVSLDVGHTGAETDMTDERIRLYNDRNDPSLAALLFQYGRYLMIAGSRPGGQPLNLQGIWNDKVRPPWQCCYYLDMNMEMNYWLAEPTNLAECALPLLQMIEGLADNGRQTARVNYGLSGWTAHVATDLWRQSAPGGKWGASKPKWENWPMGGVWLSQHLWEHYAFNGDLEYLQYTAWPLMKGAAEFCLGWLVEDEHGRLVTSPATSPENDFFIETGETAEVSMATTSDMALIYDLFTNCIEATLALNRDASLRLQLERPRERLYRPKIGSQGQLLEWFKEFPEPDPHHRHLSHLIGLYPGRQITRHTPELLQATQKALERRGDGGTGWSRAWKISLWARLGDGNRAFSLLRNLLRPAELTAGQKYALGVYPNLFHAHPPFQIDANLGATAGITEMLFQSHADELTLLPAIPAVWPNGSVSGLRARGGFEVDIRWHNGTMTETHIRSLLGRALNVRCGKHTIRCDTTQGQTIKLDETLQIVP